MSHEGREQLELVFFFNHVGLRDQTQVISFGEKNLYPQSHLVVPRLPAPELSVLSLPSECCIYRQAQHAKVLHQVRVCMYVGGASSHSQITLAFSFYPTSDLTVRGLQSKDQWPGRQQKLSKPKNR